MFKLITKKRLLYYDKVIKLHKEKGYSGLEISKIIPVNPSSITRWIRIFAEEKPCVEELKQQKASTEPIRKAVASEEDISSLRNEIARLKRELRAESLRADAY
ncbi:MAG: transposase, partial [Prevotella sp.]|nr:transposase [Prevotella sp.]